MLLFSLVPCAEDCEQLWCYQPWNTFGNSVSQTHSLFTWKWKQIVCSSFNIAVVCKAWGWTYSCILLLSRSVMSESLQPRGLQHSRLACPSPSSRACSNSCPLNQWCHRTISSSVFPFSSCLQSFPESGSFPVSWLFKSGGQSIWASASAPVLPMNIQGWFPLGLTGLISLQSKGLSRVFSNNTVQNHQFFGTQPSLWSNSDIHTWLLEKP